VTSFATLPPEERALYWRNYANRTGVPEFIAEKDFWVCWLLGHIFATPQLGSECVFKGGTSLSKVFGAIDRFSEDIDLGLTPASLGWEETGLTEVSFSRPQDESSEDLVTPAEAESCWKKPGPVAGPFKVTLGDGSTVTYHWYRFADQPALLNADLTDQERETLQRRVEKLHRHWPKDRNYLTPPSVGTLASVDPALIVTPPEGLEVGYVPLTTRQARE